LKGGVKRGREKDDDDGDDGDRKRHNPNTSQPFANPYPSQPFENPYPSQPFANPYPSQPVANPYPSQPVANPYPSTSTDLMSHELNGILVLNKISLPTTRICPFIKDGLVIKENSRSCFDNIHISVEQAHENAIKRGEIHSRCHVTYERTNVSGTNIEQITGNNFRLHLGVSGNSQELRLWWSPFILPVPLKARDISPIGIKELIRMVCEIYVMYKKIQDLGLAGFLSRIWRNQDERNVDISNIRKRMFPKDTVVRANRMIESADVFFPNLSNFKPLPSDDYVQNIKNYLLNALEVTGAISTYLPNREEIRHENVSEYINNIFNEIQERYNTH
jgi:hypothetical protein